MADTTNIWRGSILQKDVLGVGFVPLEEMNQSDWDYLDFKNIRPIAKNRIVSAMLDKKLLGFYDVRVTVKVAKPRYLWPAIKGQVATEGSHEFFRNLGSEDDDVESAETLDFEDTLDRLEGSFSLSLIRAIVRQLDIEDIQKDHPAFATAADIEKKLNTLQPTAGSILALNLMLRSLSLVDINAFMDGYLT